MKILITGASGPFATSAINQLLEKIPARDLILMSRSPTKLDHFAKLGCDIRYGDFEKPDSVEAAAQGAERMLLISGHMVGHRVEQHGNAIDAAKRAGVTRIAYTSYYGSDADCTAMVCQDHYGTEQKLAASGLEWVALRDGMYGDTMINAAIPAALRTGEWVTSAPDSALSFIDRRECSACALAALLGAGGHSRIYNITGEEVWTFRQVAELATELTGRPITMVQLDDQAFFDHLIGMGIPADAKQQFNMKGFEWCAEDMTSFEREMRNNRFAIKSHDVKALLGHDPKPFRQMVVERIEQIKVAAEI
jgi:NAD(P)H dehydrogenase (quinone)